MADKKPPPVFTKHDELMQPITMLIKLRSEVMLNKKLSEITKNQKYEGLVKSDSGIKFLGKIIDEEVDAVLNSLAPPYLDAIYVIYTLEAFKDILRLMILYKVDQDRPL